MTLKQLRRQDKQTLYLVWLEGHEGPLPLVRLRDACPCAGCKGETILFQKFEAPAADRDTPGRYELVRATPVGNYAIQFTWGDGHSEGIYTMEQLRSLCSCDICLRSDKP